MKFCICTTPIRPYPTDFPPFGSMAIIQSLRKIRVNADFFNIDYFRYSHEEIEAYFKKYQFDVVGISAVVSTAYLYTKYLSKLIREVSPNTLIIVGGNLGASAEILLRKCEVDFCVIGDGENIIRELIPVLGEKPLDYNRLMETKGIAFLDEQKNFCFTGFGVKPSAEEIEFPDYNILESDGSLSFFIPKVSDSTKSRGFGGEQLAPGKRTTTVITAKGCVARCTFCHRFEQGFRTISADEVTDHLRHLMSKYDVGYITVGDENFGSDQKITRELVKKFAELGLKWRAAGVRTRTTTKEMLQYWKDNGCTEVIYGIESGSPKMLEVMEKNLTLEHNTMALKWTGEVGLYTTLQLVIGMPGENDDTIFETIEFLKEVAPYIKKWESAPPSQSISINYAQALPGTPLYEFAREHGLIGMNIDDEEQYLINISDIDAYSEDHFVNLTGLPLLKVLIWRPIITSHLDAHQYRAQNGPESGFTFIQVVFYYVTKAGDKLYRLLRKRPYPKEDTSGYFNISYGLKYAPLLLNPVTKKVFYPLLACAILIRHIKKPIFTIRLLLEYIRWYLMGDSSMIVKTCKSLRKIVSIRPSKPDQKVKDQMLPLRKGR